MRWPLIVLAALLGGCLGAHSGSGQTAGQRRPQLAYVTNGIASFWVIAQRGAETAARDLDVDVEVVKPPKGVGDQKRMVQDLLARGVDGVAISPIDPDNQQDLLDEVARHADLITHDSDAPNSKRRCYVGMDNYTAGRMCGQLVKEALPAGGSVMLFVGRIKIVAFDEQDETLQGIVDGGIYGTVVQNPYRYGYESVRILAGLARGDQSVLPEGGFLDIPARKITSANVDPFWAELKQLLGKSSAARPTGERGALAP